MKCPYPGCRASVLNGIVSLGGEEQAEGPVPMNTEPSASIGVGEEYCLEHQAITCRYPLYEPFCQERPTPRSVYCKEHDRVASFVKLFHAALHQEAAQRQQQLALNHQLEENVRRDLFGKRN